MRWVPTRQWRSGAQRASGSDCVAGRTSLNAGLKQAPTVASDHGTDHVRPLRGGGRPQMGRRKTIRLDSADVERLAPPRPHLACLQALFPAPMIEIKDQKK